MDDGKGNTMSIIEANGLNAYNRPQLIKIICAEREERKILEDALHVALDQIEELRAQINKDINEYDFELQQQKEREQIS